MKGLKSKHDDGKEEMRPGNVRVGVDQWVGQGGSALMAAMAA